MPIRKFYTMEEFATASDETRRNPDHAFKYARIEGAGWYSGETNEDTARLIRSGDLRSVERARGLLDKIFAELPPTERADWTPSPAGAYPIVPEFLAGHPEPMRARRIDANASNPVRLWACLTCSAGVKQDTLRKRGAAMMALLLKLAEIRPVELWAVVFMDSPIDGEGVIAIRLPSDPLSEAHCAYALTSSGFTRGFGYDYIRAHWRSSGSWPHDFKYGGDNRKYLDALKIRLGGEPHDLMIEPAKMSNEKISTDPVGWVNDQIRAILAAQENR
jgi:hypothetical protein